MGWRIGVAATEEIPSVDGAVGPLKANKLKRFTKQCLYLESMR